MMRALWTAASGMISQQQNVDTISNNLANVNTIGYKKERMEFKTLLYQTMERASLDPENQTGKPVNLQIGLGVRPVAVAKVFTMGNLERTDHPLDMAIEGMGFFTVRRPDQSIAYTKDGAFKVSPTDGGLMLVTADGNAVLGTGEEPIVIPDNVAISALTFDQDGTLYYVDDQNQSQALGMQINIVQFPNTQGMESVGSNLLVPTGASGDAIRESDGGVNRRSRLIQNVLEMANVQVAEEMVNLIVAQRAYDLNSKAIQTSDDMLQTANNLKRG